MAVVIRLSRRGAPKRPFYRIIVSPRGSKRDSKFIEIVGTYNPMTNPPTVELKADRVQYWVGVGAMPSDVVGSIIKHNIPDFLEPRAANKLKKVQAARKKRKARIAASGKTKAPKAEKVKKTKKAAPKKTETKE